jgi:ABC-type uncharacterized transport system permease subunit
VNQFAALFSGGYSDAMALGTLLTVESLLFASISVAVGLSAPGGAIRNLQVSPRALATAAACFLGLVAVAAFLCWTGVFIDHWPANWRGALIAFIIAGAIIGQPVLAWIIARGIGQRATRTGGGG